MIILEDNPNESLSIETKETSEPDSPTSLQFAGAPPPYYAQPRSNTDLLTTAHDHQTTSSDLPSSATPRRFFKALVYALLIVVLLRTLVWGVHVVSHRGRGDHRTWSDGHFAHKPPGHGVGKHVMEPGCAFGNDCPPPPPPPPLPIV